MSLQQKDYKKSETRWFNTIPAHWRDLKIKFLLSLKDSEKVGDDWNKTQLLSLTQKGVILKDINDGKGKTHSDYSTYNKVDSADLIFCLFDLDETPRTVGLSAHTGMITSAYTIFRTGKEADALFYYYFFESIDDKKALKPFYSGMRKVVRVPVFLNIKIPCPPIKEQKVIARFLQKETMQIDTLISEKQNFIKLLEEKRQALISHVVTKGLDDKVKMKDSGVEWIGEVPEHWELGKLKFLVSIKNGQDYKHVETDDENGFPVYGSGGIFRYATDFLYDGESILYGRKGTVDKPLHVTGKFWSVDTMFYSVLKSGTYGRFAYYLSTTIPFSLYQTNTALPSMTQGDLLNNPVAYPCYSEQQSIAHYLDEQTAKIKTISDETQNSIALLKERRSALISAAVTGKIDVREEV